jgi:hypothetical protein
MTSRILAGRREIYVLGPGYYVAICSTTDPETGMPHLLLGEIGAFTVDEPATSANRA